MKKVLSLIAALSLTLSMSATVFAAETGSTIGDVTKNNTQDIAITAQYTKGENKIPTVYNVTVSWEQTGTLKYSVGSDTYDWQTDSLSYHKTPGEAKWDYTDAKVNITVTNRSNAKVKASISGVKYSVDTFEGTLPEPVTVGSAAINGLETTEGKPQTGTLTYTITKVDGAITDNGSIATLTVKIEAAN